MKKFLLSAVLVMTGCDNAFVVENIDVFTCSVLPPWMADCASEEVHDKAVSLLQFGMVESKVTCEDVPFHASDDCDVSSRSDATYVGHRLADGSAFVTLDQQMFLLGRVEADAANMSVVHPRRPLDTWYVSGGELIVHKDGCDDIVVDLETECTGYNLEALAN
jgi:hypothetical protein